MVLTLRSALYFIVGLAMLVAYQNCGSFEALPSGSNKLLSIRYNTGSQYTAQSIAVLSSQCASCHGNTTAQGGFGRVTDVNHLVQNKYIIPGNPSGSVLYTEVLSDRMPKGMTPLSFSDKQLLNTWIVDLGNIPTTTPTPQASASPSPTGTPMNVTYTMLATNIFGPKCMSCHNAGNMQANVRLDNYAGVRAAVTPNNPAQSPVFVQSNIGFMPPGNPLSSNEISMIESWINLGALNN